MVLIGCAEAMTKSFNAELSSQEGTLQVKLLRTFSALQLVQRLQYRYNGVRQVMEVCIAVLEVCVEGASGDTRELRETLANLKAGEGGRM